MENINTNQLIRNITRNINKVFVGHSNVVEIVIVALLANGHVLIDDIPGIGKTTLVKALAKSLDLSFGRIQCTPDLLPSDVTGFTMFNVRTGEMEYKKGIVLNNIVLADEINRASPKTQSSLLEIMEESQVTVDGKTYKVPEPFMLLATQNPVEHVGTFPLPEAQLDRFMIRISLGYPNKDEEIHILSRSISDFSIDDLQPIVSGEDILNMQREALKIHVAGSIKRYITEITNSTRNHPEVSLGCSPRASVLLMQASQALALVRGRDYVSPDDIQYLAKPVLAHRLILKNDIRKRIIKQNHIIEDVIGSIKVPLL